MLRGVSFGGNRIEIQAFGPTSAGILDLLFEPSPEVGAAPPVALFALWDEPDGGVRVVGHSELLHLGPDVGDAALKLQEATTAALAGANTTGLVLHAASVASDGRAIVLPGRSGSGKTTLSAHLATRGGLCLSDETSCVYPNREVEGLRRPFNVKKHGLKVFEALAGGSLGVGADPPHLGVRSLAGPAGTLVRFDLTRHESHTDGGRPVLHALVFPRFVAGGPTTCQRIGAAPAALQLMASLLNARNLEGHGFAAVTTLARETASFSLEYGEASDAAVLIERLFSSDTGLMAERT